MSKVLAGAFASIIGPPPAQRQFDSAVLPRRRKAFSRNRAARPAILHELRSTRRSGAAQSRALPRAENYAPAAARSAFPRATPLPLRKAHRPPPQPSQRPTALQLTPLSPFAFRLP